MKLLEMFIHRGCLSENAALVLLKEIQAMSAELDVTIHRLPEAQDRAMALDVVVTPAFVLDGKLLVVGVPRKEWLIARLNSQG